MPTWSDCREGAGDGRRRVRRPLARPAAARRRARGIRRRAAGAEPAAGSSSGGLDARRARRGALAAARAHGRRIGTPGGGPPLRRGGAPRPVSSGVDATRDPGFAWTVNAAGTARIVQVLAEAKRVG